MSQARLLKILPNVRAELAEGDEPADLALGADIGTESVEGADVIAEAEPMVVDTQAAEAMRIEEMDIENGAEEDLGDAMATGAAASARRPAEDQEATRRARQRMAVAAIGRGAEPGDEQGEEFNYLMASGYKQRSAESVQKSRKVEIDKFVKNGCVEDWKIDEAKASGSKILSGI